MILSFKDLFFRLDFLWEIFNLWKIFEYIGMFKNIRRIHFWHLEMMKTSGKRWKTPTSKKEKKRDIFPAGDTPSGEVVIWGASPMFVPNLTFTSVFFVQTDAKLASLAGAARFFYQPPEVVFLFMIFFTEFGNSYFLSLYANFSEKISLICCFPTDFPL